MSNAAVNTTTVVSGAACWDIFTVSPCHLFRGAGEERRRCLERQRESDGWKFSSPRARGRIKLKATVYSPPCLRTKSGLFAIDLTRGGGRGRRRRRRWRLLKRERLRSFPIDEEDDWICLVSCVSEPASSLSVNQIILLPCQHVLLVEQSKLICKCDLYFSFLSFICSSLCLFVIFWLWVFSSSSSSLSSSSWWKEWLSHCSPASGGNVKKKRKKEKVPPVHEQQELWWDDESCLKVVMSYTVLEYSPATPSRDKSSVPG